MGMFPALNSSRYLAELACACCSNQQAIIALQSNLPIIELSDIQAQMRAKEGLQDPRADHSLHLC